MKAINYLILFVFALAIVGGSCKKAEKTNTEILTSTDWKYSTMTYNGTNLPLDACQLDDYLTFSANGTMTSNYGTLHCIANETTQTGAWSLSTDGKSITMNSKTSAIVITANSLVITSVSANATTVITFVPR